MTRAIPTPSPAAFAPPRGYDRARWTAAVLAGDLPPFQRLLALVLAHRASPSGELAAGGRAQEIGHLSRDLHLDVKKTRAALTDLEQAGWIRRPDKDTWQPRQMTRPITLVMPSQAARTEPAHPSEHAS